MPLYDKPYRVFYLDQKNKLKLSEGEKIEVENGFVAIYGVADGSAPKRVVPMHKVAEVYRHYEEE